jgi:hypothetical protein
MKPKLTTISFRAKSPNRQTGSLCLMAAFFVVNVIAGNAQTFSSGSDGSDGAYAPTGSSGTVILFDPSQFHGTQVAANIFNFTTITIPTGVTVKFSGNNVNGPIFLLAQGDVDIEGTLDLSGGNGAPYMPSVNTSFERQPAIPGSGGFAGGVGGNTTQAPLPGNGTGGGAAGTLANGNGVGGNYGGNQLLIPLVGGSGGGGALGSAGVIESGGGAGGGAILIASSTRIIINGVINANGGQPGGGSSASGGGGSGGAMRLVSNAITGNGGTLTALGGGGNLVGGPGLIREESSTTFYTTNVYGTLVVSTPIQLLLPTAGSPSASVISINGTAVTPNPSTFPDITINTTAPVPVVIETQNIPSSAIITLTILDENNVPDTVITAPPLSNCTSNVCTTTVNVKFPYGGSFGLTKVNWTV